MTDAEARIAAIKAASRMGPARGSYTPHGADTVGPAGPNRFALEISSAQHRKRRVEEAAKLPDLSPEEKERLLNDVMNLSTPMALGPAAPLMIGASKFERMLLGGKLSRKSIGRLPDEYQSLEMTRRLHNQLLGSDDMPAFSEIMPERGALHPDLTKYRDPLTDEASREAATNLLMGRRHMKMADDWNPKLSEEDMALQQAIRRDVNGAVVRNAAGRPENGILIENSAPNPPNVNKLAMTIPLRSLTPTQQALIKVTMGDIDPIRLDVNGLPAYRKIMQRLLQLGPDFNPDTPKAFDSSVMRMALQHELGERSVLAGRGSKLLHSTHGGVTPRMAEAEVNYRDPVIATMSEAAGHATGFPSERLFWKLYHEFGGMPGHPLPPFGKAADKIAARMHTDLNRNFGGGYTPQELLRIDASNRRNIYRPRLPDSYHFMGDASGPAMRASGAPTKPDPGVVERNAQQYEARKRDTAELKRLEAELRRIVSEDLKAQGLPGDPASVERAIQRAANPSRASTIDDYKNKGRPPPAGGRKP
jgi:hypothetical protein